VINVRGRVLPLGDLAVVLDAAPARDGGRDPATVVLVGPRHADVPALGVLGEVLDIVELDAATVEPPPPFGLGPAAPLVTGVVRLAAGGLALVLDPEQLLAAMGAGEGPQ
jgi:chemotaxis signal transduction protein